MTDAASATGREILFLSKGTANSPDNEFAMWLAPRLEAAGYKVFADIQSLQPGDRWRREITDTLQTKAVKFLLCCRDDTLQRQAVQEEIGMAEDLARELKDPKFIIPLRLEPYKKVFGIGEVQYIDFVRGWAEGLGKLLTALKIAKVPSVPDDATISPFWESFRRRSAIPLKEEPERLTSNWLRVASAPDTINLYQPRGSVGIDVLKRACDRSRYPTSSFAYGFWSFATLEEVNEEFANLGIFEQMASVTLDTFTKSGHDDIGVKGQEGSNIVHSMFRQAWGNLCRERGLREKAYSSQIGFHVNDKHTKVGQRLAWGRQGERRSSMLRNIAKGNLWEFGVTAIPAFWPYYHFKIKSRVLFSPVEDNDKIGDPYLDPKKQHKLRRSVCKGWRNKQWYGRLLAFLELLAEERAFITLSVSPSQNIQLDASPILFTSPVSTLLPNKLDEEQEEVDPTTLGRPEPEDDV